MTMAGVLLIMPANGLLTAEALETAEPDGAATNRSYRGYTDSVCDDGRSTIVVPERAMGLLLTLDQPGRSIRQTCRGETSQQGQRCS